MSAAPIPAAAMSFFIVRDFFSFDLFAECPVGPRSAQFPSASKANLAICPSQGFSRRPSRSGRPAAECDEPGWFHW